MSGALKFCGEGSTLTDIVGLDRNYYFEIFMFWMLRVPVTDGRYVFGSVSMVFV